MSGDRKAAKIIAVIGASGSGKTWWIREQLRRGKPRRLIVWDPKPTSNYADMGHTFTTIGELSRAMAKAGPDGALRAIYRPGESLDSFKDKFDLLCHLAFKWKGCTLVGEELGQVTRPGWSPNGWLLAVTQGREEGLTVFGVAQRPALIDKTILSNASLIHCGRLSSSRDRATMADELDVQKDVLRDMQPGEWIERLDTGETRTGGKALTAYVAAT